MRDEQSIRFYVKASCTKPDDQIACLITCPHVHLGEPSTSNDPLSFEVARRVYEELCGREFGVVLLAGRSPREVCDLNRSSCTTFFHSAFVEVVKRSPTVHIDVHSFRSGTGFDGATAPVLLLPAEHGESDLSNALKDGLKATVLFGGDNALINMATAKEVPSVLVEFPFTVVDDRFVMETEKYARQVANVVDKFLTTAKPS